MDILYQDNSELYPIIQHSGCFFMSCLYIAQIKTGKTLSAVEINKIWEWGKNTHRIDDNDCIVNSVSIIMRAYRYLSGTGRFYEVGTFSEGKSYYYPSVGNEYRRADFLIQKIKQGGAQGTHFRVVDKVGNVIYDPYSKGIQSKGIVYSILYCFVPEGEND